MCRRTSARSRWCSRATRSIRRKPSSRTSPLACGCAARRTRRCAASSRTPRERLEITDLLQRRPAELSGGQRQRVALGRAIVRQPTAFLMDEPLSNLDAALRLSMRVLIKRLHQSMATTFVYVTHDQGEAMSLADRIVVMRGGQIQQIGTPDEIYRKPQQRLRRLVPRQPPDQPDRRRIERWRRRFDLRARRHEHRAEPAGSRRQFGTRGIAGRAAGGSPGLARPASSPPPSNWSRRRARSNSSIPASRASNSCCASTTIRK